MRFGKWDIIPTSYEMRRGSLLLRQRAVTRRTALLASPPLLSPKSNMYLKCTRSTSILLFQHRIRHTTYRSACYVCIKYIVMSSNAYQDCLYLVFISSPMKKNAIFWFVLQIEKNYINISENWTFQPNK